MLVLDFIDQPTNTFPEGLAECQAGRTAKDLPASLDYYLSWPGKLNSCR